MTVPPGVYYRGMVMTKHEMILRRKKDFSIEVKSPRLDNVQRELEGVLDVTQE